MPRRSASRALTSFPESRISSAFDRPTIFERRAVPPWLGIQARSTSGWEKTAVSSAIRISQARASSAPAPRAVPETAAIVGRVRCSKDQNASWPRVTHSWASFGGSFAHSSTSRPEEKVRPPSPATTTARTISSFSRSETRDARSEIMGRDSAFRGGFSIHNAATLRSFSMRTRAEGANIPRVGSVRITVAQTHAGPHAFLGRGRYSHNAGGGRVREALVSTMAERFAAVADVPGHPRSGTPPTDGPRAWATARGHVLRKDRDVPRTRCGGGPLRCRPPVNRRSAGGPRVARPPEHPAFRHRILRGPPCRRSRRPDESDLHAARTRGPVERRGRRDGRGPGHFLAKRREGEACDGRPARRPLRRRRISQDASASALSHQEEARPTESGSLALDDSARTVDPSLRQPREDSGRFDGGYGPCG